MSRTNLKKLTLEQVLQIDDLLSNVGGYGEVVLVIEHGRLRYINAMESHKVQNSEAAAKRKTQDVRYI